MKISRLEFVALLLAAVFAAFAAGWFFRGQAAPQPVRVETERTLTQETPLALPAPTPSPSAQSKEDTLAGGAKINLNTAGVAELMTGRSGRRTSLPTAGPTAPSASRRS